MRPICMQPCLSVINQISVTIMVRLGTTTAVLALASCLVATIAVKQGEGSQRWVELDTGNSLLPKPTMAAAAGVVDNSTVVVFGGCTSSCCFAPLDTLWQLEVSSDHSRAKWTEVTPSSSSRPSARFYSASASVGGGRVLFFGGQDSSMKFLDQLWLYSHADNGWSQVEVKGPAPSPRATATLSVVGDYLVLYGGYGLDGVKSDMWALGLSDDEEGGDQLAWRELKVVHGDAPARSNHIAVPVLDEEEGGSYLVVFGGSDAMGQDTDTTSRAVMELEEGTVGWDKMATTDDDDKPSIRHGHIAIHPRGGEGEQQVTVFGGLNTTADTLPTSFLGDSYTLDIKASKWSQVPQDEVSISARAYSAVAHLKDMSVVFGGFSGYTGDVDDRLLNDVWLYRHHS